MSCNEASGGDLANVVHSLTISGLNPRQCTATLAVVAKRVTAMDLSHSGVIEPKQLAAVFWGFVKLEFTDDDVMTYLVRSATARMDEFNSQDLSMVSWALAKSLPLLPTEGYHAAVQCCISKIALRASTVSLSSTQAVTNTLWALARCRQAGLVVPLRGVKMKPLKQRTSQNVANYLWSLCVLELPCPDQSELIDLITIAFTTRECCNVVWALAHWPEAADLAWSLLPRIIEESAQLSPLDIASLSKAVAMAVADSGAESLNRPMHVCF
ncbi:hypothetical protein Pmar_PMAR018862 [Perkinsus marinus ATCC 50983]|uniref:Uncharacterized protein n=1 Tax=Perkinsus marinus (strain ATCC 50983 / TXsc) TaxID=423536 RepID=C5L9V1_PERM5|nr:hypothetical protein Pmar_PMAR018862 [Perkinsus marinus ATCC 50983]EER06492.1 hypothetical protein Pmar_PMAR018862 [Perkinsus marinus ATCC 50983]|eukprot:XP_002774676.1 hypothetical protein Pmar_PMAR018862 [Perkinsus marinus ATCC 50983]